MGDVGQMADPLWDHVSRGREVTVSYLCFEKITGGCSVEKTSGSRVTANAEGN